MEIYEMKYFLEVSRFENLARAAQRIHVSSASLSRAISRLEEELGVALFYKNGRNIRLSPAGVKLQKKLSKIVQLEEEVRLSMAPRESALNLEIMAEEAIHQNYSFRITDFLKKKYPRTKVTMIVTNNNRVIQSVKQGDVTLGVVTGKVPDGVDGVLLGKERFHLFCGHKHALAKKNQKEISLNYVLEQDFIICGHSIFGVLEESSTDGWNDQLYPRNMTYTICSLKGMEQALSEGKGISYLPENVGKQMKLHQLNISSLPKKVHNLYLISKFRSHLSWVREVFDHFST